jgi:hypothetical protein
VIYRSLSRVRHAITGVGLFSFCIGDTLWRRASVTAPGIVNIYWIDSSGPTVSVRVTDGVAARLTVDFASV